MAPSTERDCDAITSHTNALSTSVSYYHLYRKQPKPSYTPEFCRQDDSDSKEANSSSGTTFWEEDEWTDQCEVTAKQTLKKHKSKCHLVSTATKNPLSSENQKSSPLPCGAMDNEFHHNGSYWVKKYEDEADLHWDGFYERNQTKFFKDRHYLHKTFPHEARYFMGSEDDEKKEPYTLYEIGCGVGNNVLPLLSKNSSLHVHCFDFSSVAINLLNQNPEFCKAKQEGRASAEVWDITQTLPTLKPNSADCTMLLFCLSAINPAKMETAAHNVASTLKPGGVILFRDYGRYDEAQMKLGTQRGKGLGENFYVKHDGTRCYYFELNDLERLFGGHGADNENKNENNDGNKHVGAGLEILELKYIRRAYKNRGTQTVRRRVWVQGRFRKPMSQI